MPDTLPVGFRGDPPREPRGRRPGAQRLASTTPCSARSAGGARSRPTSAIGWGIVRPIFYVVDRREAASGGGHVAFGANGISAVKAAWEGGVNAGGDQQGDPGQRPEYGPTYYAAYLRDPDGHRIEITVGDVD